MNQMSVKEMTDQCMEDFGKEAEEVGRKKGIIAMEGFINKKMEPYRVKWASKATPSVPVSEEMAALRAGIGRDIALRLGMGHKAFNPSSFPLTRDLLELRGRIAKDVDARLMRDRGLVYNPSSSIEDQAKGIWNRDPNLREEFFNNFPAYAAYLKAEAAGQVRIAGEKVIR